MSLAVATTKTGLFFSCIHVRKLPNRRVVTSAPPPIPPIPAKAFSNSSTHRTQGEIASARAIAFLKFSSLSPTYFPISRPISIRRSGTSKRLAAALALRDFPHPGTPAINTPLGKSTPKASACFRFFITTAFFCSHFFNTSSPPISSSVSFNGIISRIPDFLIFCCFCSKISFISVRLSSPLPLYARLRILNISDFVSPLKFRAISFNRVSDMEIS